jgi:rSAM/selenodomain-associated transferase 1
MSERSVAAGPSAYAQRLSRTAALVVFAKALRPGLVKTRMSPPLSAEEAAEFYAHMLDDVLCASAGFVAQLDLAAIIAVYPPDAGREIAARAPGCFRIVAQRGLDLAQRMTWAVAEAAASGATRILLRSSDSPILARTSVEQCLVALEDHDLAICPDLDGGYGLIGLRRPVPGLFDHPMSTRSVLNDTLENARRLGLRSQLLVASPDLDTVEDLSELARRRLAGECELCPQTLAFLDERGLWPEPQP